MGRGTRSPRLFGRDEDVTLLEELLEGVREGPVALVIMGEPGIGKTALWSHVIERSLGTFRILRCRPGESEVKLPYAALGDLLDGLPEEPFEDLPIPQRAALEVALLRAPAGDRRIERRTVATAFLGILRWLASSGPVLLAIDDIQWLDVSSARALEFALRRLDGEPLAVLATHWSRSGQAHLELEKTLPHGHVRTVQLGPLDLDALDRILHDRLGQRFLQPAILQVHQISAGNPFYALEIARTLTDRKISLEAGEKVPVPQNLRRLLKDRLIRLPEDSRRILPLVAAASSPTVDLLHQLCRRRADTALKRAIELGILEVRHERVAFSHPLLASIVYDELTSDQRRDIHARLAGVVSESEERAMHLALAASGPDARAAAQLDDASRRAKDRGAPDAAADLLELAVRLTPPGRQEEAMDRSIAAADAHFRAGNVKRAIELLEGVIARLEPGPRRAEALRMEGIILAVAEGWTAAARLFRHALRDAERDGPRRAGIERALAYAMLFTGALSSARRHARKALDLTDVADRSGLAESLPALAYIQFMLGHQEQGALFERALQVEKELDRATVRSGSEGAYSVLRPSYAHAQTMKYSDRLDEARPRFEALLHSAEEEGDESSVQPILSHLAELECWAGEWAAADRYAERALTLAMRTGMAFHEEMARYARGLVDARLGRVEQAGSAAERGLALAESAEEFTTRVQNQSVLGFLSLSLGDASQANRHLGQAFDLVVEAGVREPGIFRFHPDAVEALVVLGDLERAGRVVDWLEERGRALRREWALAAAARCRALLTAVAGETEAALAAFEDAVDRHEALGQPFELGRTLLLGGITARRARKKRQATVSLERALRIFEELGASLWSKKAHSELLRNGRRPPSRWALTATEERVAGLVGSGRTNREVADALFMSSKTVEWNLSKIYRKLQIRSRTELAARLRDIAVPPEDSEDRGSVVPQSGDSPGSSDAPAS